MYLRGQAGQRGYAMAALLMSVAVMAIVMSALLPTWRQQVQREKEAELAFRGEQYARAIYLFQRSNGGQYPPSLDVLVSGRYIRKKYKDPMTEDGEFVPVAVGANQPGPQGGRAGQRGVGPGQRGVAPGQRGAAPGQRGGGATLGGGRSGQPSPGLGGSQPIGGARGGGGIMTVASKSKAASIRIYNGASHYNEWMFLYNRRGQQGAPGREGGPGGGPTQGRPGVGAPGRGGRGPGGPTGPGRGSGPRRGGGPGLGSGGRGR